MLSTLKKWNRLGGFSMMEAMIAVGLMGGVSLIFASLMKQQAVGQRKSTNQSEIFNASNQIVGYLNNPISCKRNFPSGTALSGTKTGTLYGVSTSNDLPIDPASWGSANTKIGDNVMIKSVTWNSPVYGGFTPWRVKANVPVDVTVTYWLRSVNGATQAISKVYTGLIIQDQSPSQIAGCPVTTASTTAY